MTNVYQTSSSVDNHEFYGRKDLIDKLLHESNRLIWLQGNRRVGKTSLLRRLRDTGYTSGDYLAFYMDFGGSTTLEDWTSCLYETVFESRSGKAMLNKMDIQIENAAGLDFFELQDVLDQHASQAERKLLLLCDECEAWIDTIHENPRLIQRLRKVWSNPETGSRVIVSATGRLSKLMESEKTQCSPLLTHLMPIYIAQLRNPEADALIEQRSNQKYGPVKVAPETKEKIKSITGNHPCLIQYLCYKLYQEEDHSLREIRELEDLELDDYLIKFFWVDYEGLEPIEQQLLLVIANGKGSQEGVTSTQIEKLMGLPLNKLKAPLRKLIHLGMVNTLNDILLINNHFLQQWLLTYPEYTSPGAGSLQTASAERRAGLLGELRQALLDCGPFESDSRLRAVFAHPDLQPWQNRLPQASNPEERVDLLINHLMGQKHRDGRNALGIFLYILVERIDPETECYHRLTSLADKY